MFPIRVIRDFGAAGGCNLRFKDRKSMIDGIYNNLQEARSLTERGEDIDHVMHHIKMAEAIFESLPDNPPEALRRQIDEAKNRLV